MDPDAEDENILAADVEQAKEEAAPGEYIEGEHVTTSDHQFGKIDKVEEVQSGTGEKIITVEILTGPEKGQFLPYPEDDIARAA